jgi:hypothetical protein
MPINLTRFYELMAEDYTRLVLIVENSEFCTHPDFDKIKQLAPQVFQKGQTLEKLTGAFSLYTLKTEGDAVEDLTKEIEKIITPAITNSIHKAIARFLQKYAKRFSEGHVVSNSALINSRFPHKRQEASEAVNRLDCLFRAAEHIIDINGITEALTADYDEVGDGLLQYKKNTIITEQDLDLESFEQVNSFDLSKYIEAFRILSTQLDFYIYKNYIPEVPGIWNNPQCGLFEQNPQDEVGKYTLKHVEHKVMAQHLQVYINTLLKYDAELLEIWNGKALNRIQKVLPGVKEKKQLCRKLAMAVYCNKIYTHLQAYEDGLNDLYNQYFNKTELKQESDEVSAGMMSYLYNTFSAMIVAPVPRIEDNLSKSWTLFLDRYQLLLTKTLENMTGENQEIVVQLKKYGTDSVKDETVLDKAFLDLKRNVDEELTKVKNLEKFEAIKLGPALATFHPNFSEELKQRDGSRFNRSEFIKSDLNLKQSFKFNVSE